MSVVNLRIQNKHDTTANWQKKEDEGFRPLVGEVIVYDDYITRTIISQGTNKTVKVPGVKIGRLEEDGSQPMKLVDLPFLNTQDFESHIINQDIHVSTEDRETWDNNITYKIDKDNENLKLLKRNEIKR